MADFPAVHACRAGVWCGAADHPRVVLVAQDEKELSRLEKSYRCQSCGRPDRYAAEQAEKFARRFGRRAVRSDRATSAP